MKEEQLITFETAELAKEKGFDIPTRNFYANWDGVYDSLTIYKCIDAGYLEYTDEGLVDFGEVLLLPAQSVLQKWLREKHDLDVYIIPNGSRNKLINKRLYHPQIWVRDEYQTELHSRYSYEEAMEYALSESLKLIK